MNALFIHSLFPVYIHLHSFSFFITMSTSSCVGEIDRYGTVVGGATEKYRNKTMRMFKECKVCRLPTRLAIFSNVVFECGQTAA